MTDLVNFSRCCGEDLNRIPLKLWDPAVANMKEKRAHTADGHIVYAAELLEVKPDGSLLLQYDIGGQGRELPSWVGLVRRCLGIRKMFHWCYIFGVI